MTASSSSKHRSLIKGEERIPQSGVDCLGGTGDNAWAGAHASSRWLVYLLRCRDGSLYTGVTNDLPKRLRAHAAGKASKYTRSRIPVTLVHSEPQRSKSAALKREVAIKRMARRQKELLVLPPSVRRRGGG